MDQVLQKYILIDPTQRSSYAYLGHDYLTKKEMLLKNKAFSTNRVNKKYIKEKDWN